jgi:hypothetical protein
MKMKNLLGVNSKENKKLKRKTTKEVKHGKIAF